MPSKPVTAGQVPKIFNRQRWRMHRKRGAIVARSNFSDYDFLYRRAMVDIVDRLETVKRSFDKALFYGVGDLTSLLTPSCGVGTIFHADIVEERLSAGAQNNLYTVYDEENIPFAPSSLDLVVSLMTLHNVNDLIGALSQYRLALKPDGLFIAALFAGNTLDTLKKSLMIAELKQKNGASSRVHPFADIKDIGNALTRAGLTLPVTDLDTVSIQYQDPHKIFQDLRVMGETNCMEGETTPLTKTIYGEALAQMREQHTNTQLTFDIVYATAWSPDPGQQKPAKRGSATILFEKAIQDQY